MDLIIFYIIGCIIAYYITKDNGENKVTTDNKYLNADVLLSWVTIAKTLYEKYIKTK